MRLLVAATATAILVTACSAVLEDEDPATAPVTTATTAVTPEQTSTSTAPSTAPTTEATESIRLLFTGDMLPSDDLQAQAGRYAGGRGFDFMPMLAEVAPIVEAADWAICHQETPVSDDNVGLAGYPRFNAPRELAEDQRAIGFDACSTASNHTVDLGMGGIQATLGTLDRVGIAHTGSARSQTEYAKPMIYGVQGVHVGHVAYTYALNGLPSPAPWAVNLIDPPTVLADAARLKQAGADIVVVSLHFGNELDQVPSSYQGQVVDEIMQAPEVDLIVGHHAHVVQPIERRADGRWVIFGLGNFLAQQSVYDADLTPTHRDGVMVEVTFGPAADGRYAIEQVGYVPTFVDAPSDVIRIAPDFSRARTEAALFARDAPLVDLTPR
ncbi:MAG: CapA family protein [Geodermatophilaceae bacterium]|nr:CapA family protein [Geodermatophilaceae bacterium]